MKKVLLATACLSAALALIGGGASALSRAGVQTAKGGAKASPARASSLPQKRGAAAKGKAGTQSASKVAPAKPRVRVIDENGLKALLDESAKNGRRLLINFWATWCTPCREEFPDLVRVDEEFDGREDFEFITVSLDDISEVDKNVPEFLAEMRATKIPAYLIDAKDPEAIIALIDQTWRGDLPATFLFGRKGEVLFRHKGRVKTEELREAINASNASNVSAAAGSNDK